MGFLILAPPIKCTLVTVRTARQGETMEMGKLTPEYQEECSTVLMDEDDMNRLRVKEDAIVKVTTKVGSVELRVRSTMNSPGVIAVPLGPWANALIPTDTSHTGMPSYKGIPAEVSTSMGRGITSLDKLLGDLYGGA
ncbi:MAG: molybdopterin dinucleotide binding domain-containing protein [Methanopyri archaeon]|jgi:formylmethanofuran dehydrogenase subunit D|nr:molybdopterin dinucleotide binding domain-containing protein [Methanopyri archaeon]